MGRKARIKRERAQTEPKLPHHGDGTLPPEDDRHRVIAAAVQSIQTVISGPHHQLCLYHTAVVGALADKYLHRQYALSIGSVHYGTLPDRHSPEIAGCTDHPQSYHAWLFRRHPQDRIEIVDATWRYFPVSAQEVGFAWQRELPAFYWGWWDTTMEETWDVQYRVDREKYQHFVRETNNPAFMRQIGAILEVADLCYERPEVKIFAV